MTKLSTNHSLWIKTKLWMLSVTLIGSANDKSNTYCGNIFISACHEKAADIKSTVSEKEFIALWWHHNSKIQNITLKLIKLKIKLYKANYSKNALNYENVTSSVIILLWLSKVTFENFYWWITNGHETSC